MQGGGAQRYKRGRGGGRGPGVDRLRRGGGASRAGLGGWVRKKLAGKKSAGLWYRRSGARARARAQSNCRPRSTCSNGFCTVVSSVCPPSAVSSSLWGGLPRGLGLTQNCARGGERWAGPAAGRQARGRTHQPRSAARSRRTHLELLALQLVAVELDRGQRLAAAAEVEGRPGAAGRGGGRGLLRPRGTSPDAPPCPSPRPRLRAPQRRPGAPVGVHPVLGVHLDGGVAHVGRAVAPLPGDLHAVGPQAGDVAVDGDAEVDAPCAREHARQRRSGFRVKRTVVGSAGGTADL